jgi:hypothetical protein
MKRRLAAFVALACLATGGLGHADSKDPDRVDLSDIKGEMVVTTDGAGHYFATQLTSNARVFYGDAKTMHEVAYFSFGADGAGGYEWTFWEPRAVGNTELRVRDGAWVGSCGDRDTPFHRLDENDTRKFLAKAVFKKRLWKRQSVVLARDRKGRYYFVDRLRDEYGGKGLRLFVGRKGRLSEQRLVDTVSDSEGLILMTAGGELHVDFDKSAARWAHKKDVEELVFVPLYDNRVLIYGELGVYRERLGAPCDDL